MFTIFNPLRPVLLDVLLGVVQDHRLQAHVARGIDAVHVAEGSGHGEVAVGDGGQGLIDLPHLLENGVDWSGSDRQILGSYLEGRCSGGFNPPDSSDSHS